MLGHLYLYYLLAHPFNYAVIVNPNGVPASELVRNIHLLQPLQDNSVPNNVYTSPLSLELHVLLLLPDAWSFFLFKKFNDWCYECTMRAVLCQCAYCVQHVAMALTSGFARLSRSPRMLYGSDMHDISTAHQKQCGQCGQSVLFHLIKQHASKKPSSFHLGEEKTHIIQKNPHIIKYYICLKHIGLKKVSEILIFFVFTGMLISSVNNQSSTYSN